MRRVLLTGATGFVGRHTIEPLVSHGYEVHAVARELPADLDSAATWHRADLLDGSAQALVHEVAASHLVHLAWCTEHGTYWESPENLDWAAASLLLVRAFRAAGGERAVVAGTCAESTSASLYGTAKDATRRVLEAYAAAEGLSLAWGRIFFPYGPGERPERVVPSVARAALAGEPVACSSGEQVRDFLYVEDVGSAFAALLDSSVAGSVDVGSGEGIALREVLLQLERLAGREGIVGLGELPPRDEPRAIVADAERLRQEVGWQPKVGLSEGLERTLEWWGATSLGRTR